MDQSRTAARTYRFRGETTRLIVAGLSALELFVAPERKQKHIHARTTKRPTPTEAITNQNITLLPERQITAFDNSKVALSSTPVMFVSAATVVPVVCRTFAQLCDIGPRDFLRSLCVDSTTQGDFGHAV